SAGDEHKFGYIAPCRRLGLSRSVRLTGALKASFATVICLALSGCLGYHVGPVKPYYLRDVHTIAVPTFKNRTLVPRIEVLITDTVIKQLQQDGTFQIATGDNADAILNGEVSRINRLPARSVRGNVLKTTEFALTLNVRYSVTGRNGEQLAPPSEAVGTTSFFVSSDVTTVEIAKRAFKGNETPLAISFEKLGQLLEQKGDYTAAEANLLKAHAILEKAKPPDQHAIYRSARRLASLCDGLGQSEEAVNFYQKAIAAGTQIDDVPYSDIGTMLNNIALILRKSGGQKAAKPCYVRGLEMYEKQLGP